MSTSLKTLVGKVQPVKKANPVLQLANEKQKNAKLQQELADTRNQLNLAVISLESSRKAKPVKLEINAPKARQSNDRVRVIIPDTHGAKADKKALEAAISDVAALKPDEIILLGDHVDCGGFLALHHVMGYVAETSYSYEDDIAATNAFLDALQTAAPNAKIEYIEGNHECLSPDHEVLTRAGWLPIADVTTNHEVATLGWGGLMEWEKPTALVRKEYSGEMISVENRFWSTLMTPGHRVCYYGQHVGDLKYEQAGQIKPGTTRTIPVSGLGRKTEYAGITDDELRLVGWVLTDGCVTGAVRIYQSKPDRIQQINELLTRMGISFTFNFRNPRDIAPICGVEVKTSLPQGVFYICSESRQRVLDLLELKDWHHNAKVIKSVPSWASELSQRQFHAFLEAIVDGDGHPTTAEGSATLYGTPKFLNEIQRLCVVNGIRALLRTKTRKGEAAHTCLYMQRSHGTKIPTATMTRVPYSGLVHCLVTPNTNFFVRRNGTVHVTGNCRIEQWCITQTLRHTKDAEYLRRLFAPEFRLKLAERGITYYRRGEHYDGLSVPGIIKRGKCYFLHGFSTAKNAVAATQSKIGGNVVAGHTHRAQSDITRPVGAGTIGSWNPGCLCELNPLWQHTRPTDWTQGIAVQLIAKSGDFLHLNIPIINGRSHLNALLNK